MPKLKKGTKFNAPPLLNTTPEDKVIEFMGEKNKGDLSSVVSELKNIRGSLVMNIANYKDLRQWVQGLTEFVNASYPCEESETRHGQHVLTLNDCYEALKLQENLIKNAFGKLDELEKKLDTVDKTLQAALEE